MCGMHAMCTTTCVYTHFNIFFLTIGTVHSILYSGNGHNTDYTTPTGVC